MKPEHTKEFNVEHAQAGAPYCQRNGFAARIGIWDGRSFTTNTCLIGEYEYSEGRFSATSWLASGGNPNGTRSNDLVMLPLGYCEGKPVFVGDELMSRDRGLITVTPMFILANECSWPRKAPVMPKFSLQISRSATNTPIDAGFSEIIAQYLLQYRRTEIEAYWKALDEFNGVKK